MRPEVRPICSYPVLFTLLSSTIRAAKLGIKVMAKSNKNSSSKGRARLRGGTEGSSGSRSIPLGTNPGGTNSLIPSGTSRPLGHPAEPFPADKDEPTRQPSERTVEDGRTKPSLGAAAQRARDEANVSGSRPGFDEDNPRQIPTDASNPDAPTGND